MSTILTPSYKVWSSREYNTHSFLCVHLYFISSSNLIANISLLLCLASLKLYVYLENKYIRLLEAKSYSLDKKPLVF